MQPCPIREWREHYARRCLRVDFEPLADSTFHASVKPIFPELRIVRATLSPGFLFRDEDLLRDGDDSIEFIVPQSGELTAKHDQHTELLTTFADQAVIAIENTRLFEAEQQRSSFVVDSA